MAVFGLDSPQAVLKQTYPDPNKSIQNLWQRSHARYQLIPPFE